MFEPHYIYSPFYRSQGFYRPENFVLKTTEDFSGFNANFAQIPPKSPFYSGQRLAADIRPWYQFKLKLAVSLHPFSLSFNKIYIFCYRYKALHTLFWCAKQQRVHNAPKPRLDALSLVAHLKALIAASKKTQAASTWALLVNFLPMFLLYTLWKEAPIKSTPKKWRYQHATIDQAFFWNLVSAFITVPHKTYSQQINQSLISTFYQTFLVRFLELHYFPSVSIHIVPYKVSEPAFYTLLKYVYTCVYPRLKTFHKRFFVQDFVELIALAIYQCNAETFNYWFTKFMERIHWKLHKKFILYLRLFFNDIFFYNPTLIRLHGIKIAIKGKISVTGNAKKRRQYIRFGAVSLTTKRQKISYSKKVIHTATGVMGVKCFFFYT